jgi:hypothetical protein
VCLCFVALETAFDPKPGEALSYKIQRKWVSEEFVVFTNRIHCEIQSCIKWSSAEVGVGICVSQGSVHRAGNLERRERWQICGQTLAVERVPVCG